MKIEDSKISDNRSHHTKGFSSYGGGIYNNYQAYKDLKVFISGNKPNDTAGNSIYNN